MIAFLRRNLVGLTLLLVAGLAAAASLSATHGLGPDDGGAGPMAFVLSSGAGLDQDNDGQSDADETACGSDPLDETSHRPSRSVLSHPKVGRDLD